MVTAIKRVRRTPDDAKRLILETAERLLAQSGPQALRLQDIAAAAGISHPLILHHFESRAGLIRALTRQAVADLKERLVGALSEPEFSLEQQFDRVFDAFRGGLAQRLAWLATEDPAGGNADRNPMVLKDIVDAVHARRRALAQAEPPPRSDTEARVHLVAVAAFGDAMYGPQLRRSAGIAEEAEGARRFRAWLAALIGARGAESDQGTSPRGPAP